jgi:hypothetical protein
MNLKRLLNIAQEADKIGDYVTADKITNLLKTAQGGAYSVYPNQAAYQRTPQQSQQLKQAPKTNASMPSLPDMQAQMPSMPQMNQQMPQQGGVYNPGMAPGATYYTPGVVNVAQPQMTDEQKAFADLRGLKGQVYQANQVAYQNSQRPRQYPIYQTYQQPVYQGTNTQDQYNFNPNAPTNLNLYGTGYASMAMNPQLQQQQTQPPYNQQQQPQQQPQPQQQYPYNQRRNPNR